MKYTTVIGVSFVDVKGYPHGKYVPDGRNLGRIETVEGGVARNIAENFAACDLPVRFVSLTDRSSFGISVTEHLCRMGVDTRYIREVPDGGIGMWMVVLNENGDAAGQISMMPDTAPLLSLIESEADRLMEESDSVILEIDLGEKIAERVISAAERHGVPVYAIVGNLSVIEKRPDLLFRTECIICNAVEFGKLFSADLRKNSPDEMVAFLARVRREGLPSVIVTLGEHGSVTYDRHTGTYGIVPAENIRVVDTSGAGDAFLSGVVMGQNHRLSLTESAAIGTHLAALAIGTKNSAVPKNDDVLHLLRCFIKEPAELL